MGWWTRSVPNRARTRVAALLLIGVLCLSLPAHLFGDDSIGYRGRLLIDVLEQLQQQGLDLIFSSAVVREDLRVTTDPGSTDPREILDELLPPLGLEARDGPGDSILILPRRPHPGSLSGRVVAAAGGAPIAEASIRLVELASATKSNAEGRFVLRRLPVGRFSLVVEALGFSTVTIKEVPVESGAETELTVELDVHPGFVTEVIVTPSRHSVVRQEQASTRTVTGDDAVLAPTIGGDISRVVQLLPGVAAPDNSAEFNVRGSVARDVSLVLDGLELYDSAHLKSFQSPFSLIDSNVVDRIDFFGGGFTADYGDRHGGFVEISTLVPGSPGEGELELGTLNSRFSYRAPIAQRSDNWLVSTRAWYPETFRDSTELGKGEDLKPSFQDLYAKAAFALSPRQVVSVHGLLAHDRLNFDETDEEVNESVRADTNNGYVWLRALSAWSPGLTTETVLSIGRIDRLRRGLSSTDDGPVIVDDDRVIDFVGIKHDAAWQVTPRQLLKAGIDLRHLNAHYRYSNDLPEDPGSSSSVRLDPDGTSRGIYSAYRVSLTENVATELGLRWDRQTYTNDDQLSPRLNAIWRPDEQSELRVAVGRYQQSQRIHELAVEDGETTFQRAEVSKQAELSYQRRFRNGLRARVDGYYRELTDVQTRYENLFEPIELFPETIEDRVLVAPSKARLRGIELFVQGDPARPLFWWLSYAATSAEDVIDGRNVPRSWDQPHAGKFLIGYRREERWSVSLIGSAHTGWPTTPVAAERVTLPDGSTEIEPVVGERNADRLSDYLRFDIKARRAIRLSRGRIWLTVEIVNVTDERNPCCLDSVLFDPRPDGTIGVDRVFDSWLGFTPSFSVLWQF